MLNGQWRTAVHFFETAAELQPGEERILHHLAACYFQLEDKERSLQALEKISTLRPEEFNIHYLYANLCETEGRLDKAILGYERAIKCKTGKGYQEFLADIYYRLCHLYAKKGDFQKALDFYSKLMETGIVSEPAKIQCEIGQVYLQGNDIKKAMEAFEKAGELDPGLALVHFYLAICYEQLGNVDKAVSETEMYLAEYPDNWVMLLGLADLYEKTKQHEKALSLEQKAFTILKNSIGGGSKDGDEFLAFSQLLRKQDHKKEAIEVLKQATTMPFGSETNKNIHYNLANLYYEINRYDMVEKELKDTLKIDPNCHQASNFLGYFYVERGVNLDEAIQLIKKALEADPKNGAYLDSLGWAYYKEATIEGKVDKLELALEKLTAASQSTEDSLILEHLGEVYYSLGCWEKAEELWEKALGLQKEDTQESTTKQNIKERIEKLQYLKRVESEELRVLSQDSRLLTQDARLMFGR
ncbi:MAG TPA: tetratricopeptide repeat protein [Candidatus Brocadiia bacterium]|nr:tetratricopeptide repeat protein [Candidatus Brocadiales bacterium]